jgi:peptide/nickel transport system substrate-binding protein
LLRFYPTPDAALLGLGRREVQGVATAPLPGRRAPDPPQRTQQSAMPLGDYAILTFNLQQPPLNEPQFRKALVQAINRDLLITNVLGGQAQRLDTPILPGTWAADREARLPEFRRSAAQQALGALGYRAADGDRWLEREGQRLVLPLLIADAPEQAAVAGEIARQLREIGIAIEVRRVPADELQDQLTAHNFTLALHSWRDVGADPDVYALWHSSQADGKANYAGLRDPRIDELLTQGRATTSEGERTQIYRQFQQRWVELIPSLPLYQSVLNYDVDQAITLPAAPPALITSRADRFSTLDRWQVPAR